MRAQSCIASMRTRASAVLGVLMITNVAVLSADPLASKHGSKIRNADQSEAEVLTLKEAAALLRMDVRSVGDLAKNARIPARKVGSSWRFSRSALIAWLAGDWSFPTLADPETLQREKNSAPTGKVAQVGVQQMPEKPASGGAVPVQNDSIGSPPAQRSATEVSLAEQRILLSPNEVTLDVGAFYARRDSAVLLQTNTGSSLGNAESESFTTQLTARYSPFVDTELFASTSYGHRRASLYDGAQRLSQASRSEAGDVGLGVRHTLVREGAGSPEVVVGLDARIPTGETSKSLGASFTILKSADPAVLFGTLAYRHTWSREFADITRLEPKNRIDLTLGYAFALNDTISLNTAIINTFSRAASFANAQLRSNATSSVQLGMTARVAKGVYLQPSVSYRLTGPGTGFALGLNVPITLALE